MEAALGPAAPGARPPEDLPLPPGPPHRRGAWALGSPPPALLLRRLLLPLLLRLVAPGAGAAPEARIDGRALSVSSLREAESRAFTCRAAAPNLTWYLNGERQETDAAGRPRGASGQGGSGTFVVTARRADRRLDCAATDPATGHASTASVLLDVQFQPEIVKVEARYGEANDTGLLLLLLVLVRANPPADVTWVDPDGQVTVNASRFLLLDAQTAPWLAGHSVRVQLPGPPRNASLRAANALGAASAAVPLPGLLAARLELPLVVLIGAAVLALVTLLGFGVLISWAVSQKAQPSTGSGPAAQLPPSSVLQSKEAHFLQPNRSLPSNLQLNDLLPEPRSGANNAPAEQSEDAASEPKGHQAPTEQGLGPFPSVGYMHRATSTSSDEIWL